MLIKVLHQEKCYGSKKLLDEFPNKAFEVELIPTVFIVLETCVFSVVLKDFSKYHNTEHAVQ